MVGLSIPTIASDLLVGVAYIVTALGVFTQHGLDPLSAFATAGVVSAVLAFSLQSTLGNIIGGVALQLDGSIHEGDWIQLENGKQGKVRAIRWRHTLVETRDCSTIVVPNASLLANNITHPGLARRSRPRRSACGSWFNVDFRYPPSRVIEVVDDALDASPIENVARRSQAQLRVHGLRARTIATASRSYAARYWILDLAPDDPTNSRVRTRIYAALKRAGIPLAVPATANLVEMHDVDARRAPARARSRAQPRGAAHRQAIPRRCRPSELRMLADGLWPAQYAVGEKITRQGAVAHWLYILTAGNVEIRRTPTRLASRARRQARGARHHRRDGPDDRRAARRRRGRDDAVRVPAARQAVVREGAARRAPRSRRSSPSKLATRRIGSYEPHEDLDAGASKQKHESETEKILMAIKEFFGL